LAKRTKTTITQQPAPVAEVQAINNIKGGTYLPHRVMMKQMLSTLGTDIPQLTAKAAHDRTLVVVAGGQSVTKYYKEIKEHAARPDVDVYACNAMHDILLYEQGIPVKYALVVDPRTKHIKYVQRPHKDVTYWISSQCDPGVFEALKGQNVHQWHCMYTGKELSTLLGFAELNDTNFLLVRTGCTAGLCGITIGYSQGYRKFIMYGFDSCYTDDGKVHHAYDTDQVDNRVQPVMIEGKKFQMVFWMVQQCKDFDNLYHQLHDASFNVRGDGVIPYIWAKMEIRKKKNPLLPISTFTDRYHTSVPDMVDKMGL